MAVLLSTLQVVRDAQHLVGGLNAFGSAYKKQMRPGGDSTAKKVMHTETIAAECDRIVTSMLHERGDYYVIDHIIYASPDLGRGIQKFATDYGIEPEPGGPHPGFGTRNAFIGLGAQGYLEILAIDDEEPVPPSKRFLRLERRSPSRFIAWCARADRPLQETAELARAAGYDLGNVVTMSRKRPDGSLMSWHLTPFAKRDGVLPLYIDWGGTPNPATLLRPSLTLVSLTLVHPNPKRIQAIIDALGENEVAVERGSKRALLVNLSR